MTEAIQKLPPPLLPAEYEQTLLDSLREKIQPYLDQNRALYLATAQLAEQVQVKDDATMKIADDLVKSAQNELAGLEGVRESGPGAFGRIAYKLNADFKALRDPLEAAVENLKGKIGAHVVAQRNKQSENYQAAAVAHAQGDHGTAQVRLAAAGEAATRAPKGTTVKEVWAVAAYDRGQMRLGTEELPGLEPDTKRIDAYARAFAIDQTPAVPGVTFHKVPAVTSRRAK